MVDGYADFEFDLPSALLERIVQALSAMQAAELSEANLAAVPEAQGVYLLYREDDLVYIGKTDAEAGLRARLTRHRKKLLHRQGIDPTQVKFKALRIYVFTPMDLEAQLIKHYGGKMNVPWVHSGFGSNDPGRERETTTYKDNHFDKLFPIDIDKPLEIKPTDDSALSILQALKREVPYVFRFTEKQAVHPDLANTRIALAEPTVGTARELIQLVVSGLPPGWQATLFPSHVILFKETKDYPMGTVIARS